MTAALIWGVAFVAQRVGMDHLGPFTFNGLRFVLGVVSLIPLTFFLKPSVSSSGDSTWKGALVPGLICGSVLFAAASLQQVGLLWTTAGKAAFLTGFYIILVPIAGLMFRRKPSAGVWIGAPLGLAGLFLLSVTQAWTMGPGDALELVGALFWTAHILLIDRFSSHVDPLKLSVVQFGLCAVLSLTVGFSTEAFSWAGVQDAGLALLYAGFGSVGIAYTFQIFGQRGTPPGAAALILSLETVFAAVAGGLFLGEVLGERELWGCFLMLAGMVLAQVWPAKKSALPANS